MKKHKKHPILKFMLSLIIFGSIIYIFAFHFDFHALIDKFKASHFTPSSEISNLESKLNLTERGKDLFYALSPQLDSAEKFNSDCDNVTGVESGFLLGCYTSKAGQEKVTVFNAGANASPEQKELFDYDSSQVVTMAHEMLHGAYERRRWQNIGKIDHEIEQISRQIERSCQTTSPLQIEDCQILAKEMENYTSLNHSELYARLGTEIYRDKLPSALAQDYSNYFNDTTSIVNRFRNNRQQETDIKTKIEALKAEIEREERNVNYLTQQYYAYPTYEKYYSTNAVINRYNQKVEEFNSLIKLYNSTFVEQLNSKSTQTLSQ